MLAPDSQRVATDKAQAAHRPPLHSAAQVRAVTRPAHRHPQAGCGERRPAQGQKQVSGRMEMLLLTVWER